MSCSPFRSVIRAILFLSAATLLAADDTPLIARILKAADKDHDGKLNLAEYLPLDVQAKHHGDQHFKSGDANADGFIDASELATTLHKQTWFEPHRPRAFGGKGAEGIKRKCLAVKLLAVSWR